ncbi:MAG: DUF883 family protein [Alphaproteobacteria bacterium]
MSQRRISEDESALREEFSQLRADIESLIGTVGRLADGAAGSLADGAKSTASAARRRAEHAFDTVVAAGRHTLDTADKTVQAHPYLSLAVAAGLGWLLGRVMSSRK